MVGDYDDGIERGENTHTMKEDGFPSLTLKKLVCARLQMCVHAFGGCACTYAGVRAFYALVCKVLDEGKKSSKMCGVGCLTNEAL